MENRNISFRKESLNHFSSKKIPSSLAVKPLAPIVLVWSLAILFVGTIFFLVLFSYSKKEIVTGVLVPDKGMATIYPRATGVITKIHVATGDLVSAGDKIFSINVSDHSQMDEKVFSSKRETLMRQKAELQQQIVIKQAMEEQFERSTQSKLYDVELKLNLHTRRRALAVEKLSIFRKKHEAAVHLYERQLISKSALQEIDLEFITVKNSLVELQQQEAELATQGNETKNDLIDIEIQTKLEISDISFRIGAIERELDELLSGYKYDALSSVSGRVIGLQGSEGVRVTPEMMIANILPSGSNLVAKLFVPASSMGFVKEGQFVRISYSAFPKRHYGTFLGRILTKATSILKAKEVSSPIELAGDHYFICVAGLEKQALSIDSQSIELQPGMELEALIVLGEKPIIEWLVAPIVDSFKNI